MIHYRAKCQADWMIDSNNYAVKLPSYQYGAASQYTLFSI